MVNIKKIGGQISIKWKIFGYLIGFCGLLLILLWMFQVVFLDSFYRIIKINEIRQSADAIMDNLESDNLEDIIDEIAEKNSVCIELVAENGYQIYSVDVSRDCVIHTIPIYYKLSLITKTIQNGGEFLGYYNWKFFGDQKFDDIDKFFDESPPPKPENPLQTILYSKVAEDKSGQMFILFINSLISPVDATVKTLRIQLYYITGFMILFSIILAFIIAKKVSKPIQSINESAKALASGKYDISFKSSGYMEIEQLSDTLTFTARELSKVENLRRELIANVSHDLRTPLTLIQGYAEAMRDLPNENTPENAQIIIDETVRLSTLVNHLLNLSKIQSGVQTLNLTKFNLTKLLKEVINRIGELVRKDGYVIEFEYDKELEIKADEILISEAFYNLLINAINYTGEDKFVKVKQTIVGQKVKVEVTDTGEGIAPEDVPYVWDRYYKVDKTHKRAIAGTGIGLSIVKSIIEMHKGEYGIVSEINKGSTFWVSLKIN